MDKFLFNIGDIVKVNNYGITYPTRDKYFRLLNFKNLEKNDIYKWGIGAYINSKWNEMYTFYIGARCIDEVLSGTILYKIIEMHNPDMEFLIEEGGLNLISRKSFNIKLL